MTTKACGGDMTFEIKDKLKRRVNNVNLSLILK